MIFFDLIGFSGGLWLCWNSSVITLDIIMKMFHCMGFVPRYTFTAFLPCYMIILNITNKKRFGISYFILRILLVDLGLLLVILMKSYIPMRK